MLPTNAHDSTKREEHVPKFLSEAVDIIQYAIIDNSALL